MSAARKWIDVDLEGLDKTLTRRVGMVWLLHELLSNVYDTKASLAVVTLDPVPRTAHALLKVVDDDPDGFHALEHAWTLFAPSERKGDPTKRGRWNAGCKLVLARCLSAEIRSTSGSVRFDDTGRHRSRVRIGRGSEFEALILMTRTELLEALEAVKLVVPPIHTTVNGVALKFREALTMFEHTLPTEVADADGFLRRTTRATSVRVYERIPGSPGRIFELGIPVVETDDPWDVDVGQKVPLNFDRDNVTPAYLRELRVAVVNRMHGKLTREEASTAAVQSALADKRIDGEAVEQIITLQHGENRAIFDASDRESNDRLVSEGYQIIHGGMYPKEVWANIKKHDVARPAGELRPTPKPYSAGGKPADFIPKDRWTPGMQNLADYAVDVGYRLVKRVITVRFERGRMQDFWGANYGSGVLTYNHDRLGRAYFEAGITERHNALLLHELAHEREANHLSDGFYKALQTLGAKMVELALREPELFRKYGWKGN